MKLSAVLLIGLAILIAVVPPLTECMHEGKLLTTTDGRQVPMKCHWTAIASIAMAVPLLAVGIMQWFSKRKETQRALSLLGAIMGTFVILFPTTLIGVCAHPNATCNLIMRPALIFMGALVIGINVLNWIKAERRADQRVEQAA
jgi:hypothetical protein